MGGKNNSQLANLTLQEECKAAKLGYVRLNMLAIMQVHNPSRINISRIRLAILNLIA
jgi:hypothetical protein